MRCKGLWVVTDYTAGVMLYQALIILLACAKGHLQVRHMLKHDMHVRVWRLMRLSAAIKGPLFTKKGVVLAILHG